MPGICDTEQQAIANVSAKSTNGCLRHTRTEPVRASPKSMCSIHQLFETTESESGVNLRAQTLPAFTRVHSMSDATSMTQSDTSVEMQIAVNVCRSGSHRLSYWRYACFGE